MVKNSQTINFNFWLKICIFNFFIVSVVGVMMRYNMIFSLPGFNHKFMQESHSHFAFYGWVSASIFLFVTKYLSKNCTNVDLSKYQYLMISNQIGSYGMLVTFLYKGYYSFSIVFASIALFTGFAYLIFLLKDTKGKSFPEIIWIKTGAFFATFSAIGIFGLSYFSTKRRVWDFVSCFNILLSALSVQRFFSFFLHWIILDIIERFRNSHIGKTQQKYFLSLVFRLLFRLWIINFMD